MYKLPFERAQDLKKLIETSCVHVNEIARHHSFTKSRYYLFSRINMEKGVYFTYKEEMLIIDIIKELSIDHKKAIKEIGKKMRLGVLSTLRNRNFSSCEIELILNDWKI